ncbi:hypothetical protein FOZ62_025207 [Perkinsus olseni]|uniref:RRM domain-containing protein n=1 Tax=Perkinsus olseni TaxID=32597 RepID=A0A7J6UGK7_PEROL|nr:hypothetical protein FOZ62_025207 [Perkinsus olseni]
MDVLELLQEGGGVEADKKSSEAAEARPADAPKNVEEETKKRKRSRKRQRRGGSGRTGVLLSSSTLVVGLLCHELLGAFDDHSGEAKRSRTEGESAGQAPKAVDMERKARSVFLNNLPVEATSEWIKTTVLAVLPEGSNDPAVIERVHIGRDKKYPTRCAGWANVTFTSESVARDAVGKLDYRMVDCEQLLKAAEEKEQQNTAATMDSGGPVNKRCGGHGPKGIRVTRRCLYATSGLQQQQLNSNEDHKTSSKSTASQFRLPTDLIEQLRNLVREHSLSDSPAGRLADSYRRTFGHREEGRREGYRFVVRSVVGVVVALVRPEGSRLTPRALSSIPGVSTWEEKPQQIWFSWDTEEDADDDLSPPPPAADGGGGEESKPSTTENDEDVSYPHSCLGCRPGPH